MKSKILISILLCCLTYFLTAQDKGTVIFDVVPLHAQIKINNKILRPAKIGEPKTSIDLATGNYAVQIWAYGMELHEENIKIESGQIIKVEKALKPRKEFVEYNQAVKQYYDDRKQIRKDEKFRLIPFYLGIYCVAQTGVNLPLIRSYEQQANTLLMNHPHIVLPLSASNNRVEYEKIQRKHRNMVNFQRGIYYVGVPLVAGLSGYAIYKIRKKYNTLEKPVFDGSVPFTDINFDFNLQPSLIDNRQQFSLSMTLNF